MPSFLVILAQAASGGDQSSNLLGIAALVAALVPLILGIIAYARRQPSGEGVAAELVDDARDRVNRLKDDIVELNGSLARCRAARASMDKDIEVLRAQSQLKDMEIGSLQGRLADCRKALEEAKPE